MRVVFGELMSNNVTLPMEMGIPCIRRHGVTSNNHEVRACKKNVKIANRVEHSHYPGLVGPRLGLVCALFSVCFLKNVTFTMGKLRNTCIGSHAKQRKRNERAKN